MGVRHRNHVVVTGRKDGPVLMPAHGFGCDQNLWRRVAPALAHDFTVVLFDHVGVGRSDLTAWSPERHTTLDGYADDVLEICHDLALGPVTFVGHCVTTTVGVLAAVREPAAFDRLVLLTPSPYYLDDGDHRGGFSAADMAELLESLDSNHLGWSASMAPVVMGNPQRPELAEELTNSSTTCSRSPTAAGARSSATRAARAPRRRR